MQSSNLDKKNPGFKETTPKVIALMKERIASGQLLDMSSQTNEKGNLSVDRSMISQSSGTLSSKMATAFSIAGFKYSADFLQYSMLELREVPRVLYSNSYIASDIWAYSPDFKAKMLSFLNQARANGSYQYFRTTSMSFNMPSQSKAVIMGDRGLQTRADLFGALHTVIINFGVVKNNGRWNIDVIIEDTYDFKMEEYNLMTNLVNNIAYMDQELGYIKPYDLIIYAGRGNLYSLPFTAIPW